VNTIQSNNLEKMRADARYNEAAALRNAENKKAKEIAKNLFSIGVSADNIIAATGLTRNEVENLRNSN